MPKKQISNTDSQGKGIDNKDSIRSALLYNLPVAIYRTTPEGKIIEANPSFVELMGYDRLADLDEVNVRDLFVQEERRRETLEELEKPETYCVEYEVKRKNGEKIWVRDYPCLVKDENGKTIYYDGVLLDITDRKAAEEKTERQQVELEEKILERTRDLLDINDTLRTEVNIRRKISSELQQNEQKLNGIIKRSFDAILETNDYAEIIFVSPSIERISGYKPEDLIGKRYHFLVDQPDNLKIEQAFKLIKKGKNLRGIRVELLKKDGSIAYIELNASPIVAHNKITGSNINIRDITERKRAQETLIRRIEELTVLYDISRICAEAKNEDDLIEKATRIIGDTLYPINFGFLFLDSENKLLRGHSSYQYWENQNYKEVKINEGITGAVAYKGEPMLIGDVCKHPSYINADSRTKSELCVPLKLGDKILGVINTESDRYNAFSKNDERLLQTFSGQISPALERLRMEQSRIRQLKDLKVLHTIATACIEASTTPDLIQRVIKTLIATFSTTDFCILLINDKDGTITPEPSCKSIINGKRPTIEKKQGIIGRVARTGQALRVDDVTKCPYYLMVDLNTRSEICVPLKVGSKIIGVLNAESKNLAAFKEEDERLLSTVASQIALSIDALQKSTELLKEKDQAKNYLNIAGAILIAMDVDFNITLINRRGCQSFGLDSFDLIGKNWLDTCVPERLRKSENELLHTLLNNTDITHHPSEGRIITSDGSERVISWNRNVLRDSSGRAKEILCSGEDISVKKELQESLRKSEEEYRTLVQNIKAGVCRTTPDADGKILQANPAMAVFLGFSSPDELIGRKMIEFYKDRQQMEFVLEQIKKNGYVKDHEHPLITNDWKLIWCSFSSSGQFGENGALLWIDNVIEDITETKHSRDALIEEKSRLAVTLKSIADGVIAIDQEGNVILINSVAQELIGMDETEVIGKRLSNLLDMSEVTGTVKCSDPLKTIIEESKSSKAERNYHLFSKSSGLKIVTCSGAPIRDADDNSIGAVLVFHDITERTKLEEELQRAQKLESVGLLAGGIAHDFNNILAAVLGNMSLAKNYINKKTKAFRYVERAESAISRATYLTNQLLTFSKGGSPIKKVASIKDLLMETVNFLLVGSRVEVKFEFQDNLWNTIIDKDQMNQVISNIVLNAIQAMPGGGVIGITADNYTPKDSFTSVEELNSGDWVRIAIKDNGPGIAGEILPLIFDPYFTTKKDGTGLGLAISYSIVKKHQGILQVESDLGKGTTFYIFLPAFKGDVEKEYSESSKPVSGRGRILYMDDEKALCDTVKDILTDLGYTVTTVNDGTTALEIYKNTLKTDEKYDLVILDLIIPGNIGGKDTLDKMREIDPNVVAIATSGYSNDPIISDFQSYGFMGAISKPFRVNDLAEIVKKTCTN